MTVSVRLKLVVIRAADIDKSAEFYQLLALSLSGHSHGTVPFHYATEDAGCVFEIYPKTEKSGSTRATRLGFAVTNVDLIVDKITAVGGTVESPVADSEWGRRAVVRDPDGHRIELTS